MAVLSVLLLVFRHYTTYIGWLNYSHKQSREKQ